jgi:hypothetical protein
MGTRMADSALVTMRASGVAIGIGILIAFGCGSPRASPVEQEYKRLSGIFAQRLTQGTPRKTVVDVVTENMKVIGDDRRRNILMASSPEVEHSGVVSRGVYLTCRFDDRERLVSYELTIGATGP